LKIREIASDLKKNNINIDAGAVTLAYTEAINVQYAKADEKGI
jgi:hypothetical protein